MVAQQKPCPIVPPYFFTMTQNEQRDDYFDRICEKLSWGIKLTRQEKNYLWSVLYGAKG